MRPIVAALVMAGLSAPAASHAASELSPDLSAGQAVYQAHCAACHGEGGDGRGPAAVWLYPKPRDFATGLFKIQSTPPGSLPTDEDLLGVVTRGLPGSSMPSFTYLTEAERRAAVGYVKHLTTYVDSDGNRVSRFDVAGAVGEPVAVPAEPPDTVPALAQGRAVFERMQCANCHGETGAGDGPQVPGLRDTLGYPVFPRDFNAGSFRGGAMGRDLYLRIHNGLAGTPMVPYGDDVMTPDERWALVHYVLSLRRQDVAVNDMLAPPDGVMRAGRVDRLPSEPFDSFWDTVDRVRVPLDPLWPEPDPVLAIRLSAVHDGRRLAVFCQWRDSSESAVPVRVEDFQDAVALQFSMSDAIPFLGMGDAEHPVNLWQWKAGWQKEVDGFYTDLRSVYAAMHVDTYFGTSYLTAVDAGNLLATRPTTAVEDANARGFGSFTSQPAADQNVRGRGVWRDGFWSVVFLRDLRSGDDGDVQFRAGRSVPLALAVWNGEQRDRNGRKVVSNWLRIQIEP